MPGLMQRARAALARAIAPRPPRSEQPPGGFSFGTNWFGGPAYTDAYALRQAPTPWQLVERYGRLIFAMAERNKNAVARLTLRLYADASRAQGRPSRACEPIRASRADGVRFARAGMVSPAAVDRVEEIRAHPLLELLDRPDPYGYFDRRSLIGLMTVSMDVLGSFFLVPDGNGWDWRTGAVAGRPPEWLWIAYAQYMIAVRHAGLPTIEYYQYFRDRLNYESVLWFRQATSLRDPYGSAYGPTYAGDMYADQEGRFIQWYDQFIAGARPSLLVTASDPMMPPGEDARKRLDQDLNRRHSGPNAGNAVVSDGAWNFAPINYPPADEGGMKLAEYDLHRLASIFGQPPTYYTVDTNLANLQAADEQHARNGVEPRCWAIAGRLTRFVQRFDPRLFFAFDSAIQEDTESKEKVVSMMLQSGRATINQVNEEDRWPPVPWGDEPWLDGRLKQPTMLVADHEQGLAAAKAGIEQGAVKAQAAADGAMREDGEKQAGRPPGKSAEERALWDRLERLKAEMEASA